MASLDELFGDYEKEHLERVRKDEADPAVQARLEAKRKEELEREIRQGLRDRNGDWIDQPETEEEDEDEEPEDE